MGRRRWLAAIGVLALTCATFAPSLRYDFVTIDDPAYVTANPLVRAGLTVDGVRRAFVEPNADLWLPLATLSHMADVSLWGLAPGGHHLTNVCLHGLAAMLLFLVLEALTGAVGRSLVVALLFALHPLRVESVAWITERKDLLSACFALLTIDAYRRWVRTPTVGRYLATCAAFALGLLAKPMLVTIPVLLLLLDVWPLARRDVSVGRRLAEKIPLAALAAAAAWITVHVAGNAVVSVETITPAMRFGNAVVSYVHYLATMAWPTGLAVYYPFPPPWPTTTVVAAATLLVAIGALALALRARAPWLAVGWAWYLVALLPVIGIVQAGMQAMADRFTYLPSVGILVALVWSVAAAVESRPRLRAAAVGALAVALLALDVATHATLAYWHDDHALFERALAVTQRNWFIHANYGDTFLREGRIDEAAAQYERAIAIEPRAPVAQTRLGTITLARGDRDLAIYRFAEALRVSPDYAEAARGLEQALVTGGTPANEAHAAVTALRAGIRSSRDDVARPYGREYHDALARTLWRSHGDVVTRCMHDRVDATSFDLFITIGSSGAVAGTGASLPSSLGTCIAAGLANATLAAPPFAPFHAWLKMQFGPPPGAPTA